MTSARAGRDRWPAILTVARSTARRPINAIVLSAALAASDGAIVVTCL